MRLSKLYSSLRKRKHSIVFFAIVSIAILFHLGAISLTNYGISSGYAAESNSLFYSLGSYSFLIFGFAIMCGYFAAIWLIRMPKILRVVFALSLAMVPVFDFAHDFVVSTYYREFFSLLIRFVG